MAPPFRAEHIGSLLRPASLLDARAQSTTSSAVFPTSSDSAIDAITQQAIASAVKKQLALSIRPLTSGEFERSVFYSGFFEKLHGFTVSTLPIPSGFRTNFPTTTELHRRGVTTRPAAIATGKISYAESPYLGEWVYLRSLLPEAQLRECKITMPAVTWHHMQLARGTAYAPSSGYKSDEAYFADLAAAYRAEFITLYAAGLRSIQIDDPNLTYFFSELFLAGCEKDGVDADALLDTYISTHNACLRDKPKDLHIGIHLCRGNFTGSTFFNSGSYEKIAKKLFTLLDYDTFYLEYDSPRSGDFSPLRFLPVGKNVVLGVVSTKVPEMEDLGELKGRVQQAAEVIAKGQGRSVQEVLADMGVSPQCGFSSAAQGGGTGVTEGVMWEKLELVRDLAREVWGDAV
jgi:methionine synthase II (cobalamin-independent)